MKKKDKKAFINELINTFPEIRDEVLDEDCIDIISLQIGCFRRFTQKAIDINDIVKVLKCFQFIDENIEKVGFNIENSLTISWLGKLNFDKNKNAYAHLSSALKDSYINLHQYYEEQPKNEKLNSFLKDNE